MLAALATGGGGAGAVRHLAAAQYSKHLLLVWAIRDTARRTRHPQASHAARSYDLLAEVQRVAPDAVEALLRHPVSSSSQEAFGGVALSPPADALALAMSLAQEAQHAKLGAILDLVALTQPDDGQRYDAPWCDHPRCADAWCEDARRDGGRCDGTWPACALLRRAYGCLGVSGFWRWQCEAEDRAAAARARMEFRRWRDAAATATTVLEASGRLTGAGRTFVAGMAATLHAWAEDEVPRAAVSRARGGPGLPRNQLAVSGRGVQMRDEITVLPTGGMPARGVLPASVSAGGAAAGGAFRSRVPDLAGLPAGDLDRCGRARLATAARRIVTLGGER